MAMSPTRTANDNAPVTHDPLHHLARAGAGYLHFLNAGWKPARRDHFFRRFIDLPAGLTDQNALDQFR